MCMWSRRGARAEPHPVGFVDLTRGLLYSSTPAVMRGFDQGKSPLLFFGGGRSGSAGGPARGLHQGRVVVMLGGQSWQVC